MNLYFAQNFKALRRNAEMTQEDVARVFGVSTQAVSRWETGTTYPDIELLPIISEYFSVSIEQLLGVEQSRRREKAEEYKNKFQYAVERGLIDECIAVAREAVREFPRDWELQNKLMYALFVSGSDDGDIPNWQENIEKYKQEIIDIGENIIEHCTDDAIRLEAKSRLGFHYCEIGELEKGRKIFESLPSLDFCREAMIYWALRGEERRQHNREMFSQFFNRTLWNLWTVASDSKMSPRERIDILLKYEKAIALFYDEDDYGDWNLALSQLYFKKLAPFALELNEIGEAFGYMEFGIKYMKAFASMPEKYEHTTHIVKGVVDHRYADTADSRTPWEQIIEVSLSDSVYDRVREDARFVKVVEDLRNLKYK